jgi:hypothetical protein
MKIAYLILAHTDAEHICRLANRLTKFSWEEVFIHVDKKVDIEPFYNLLRTNRSVHFITERVKVYWAGYSSILATINLFKFAINYGSYDRFVILQGQDYPIKSSQEIYNFFDNNPNVEFINAIDATNSKQIKTLHKYCFMWLIDDINVFKKVWNKFNSILIQRKLLMKFKNPYIIENGKKYGIYQGWAHVALTRNCVNYIINFYNTHPKFNKFFTTTYAPDESYFHTIIYNSEFVNNTVDGRSIEYNGVDSLLNVTYFEYPNQVTVFKNKEDFDKLHKSKYLFFRKVNSKSIELLDYIDDNIK